MMEENEIKRSPRRQSPAKKNKKLQGIYLTGLLFGMVLVLMLLHVLAKDRAYSEVENRNLAAKPDFFVETVADGSYFVDLSDYLADHFPGRDRWIALQRWYHRTLGNKASDDVYLCEDGYLIQRPGEPNEEQLERNLNAINEFASAYPDVNMVAAVIPNSVTIHGDKLPSNAPVRDQLEDLRNIRQGIQKISFVDVTQKLLSHKDEVLFYRTDHHWTSLAAAYAFEEIAPVLEIQAPSISQYDRYTVSTTFEGTLASKAGSYGGMDTVEIFQPKTDILYYVKCGDGEEVCTMYYKEALDAKDHYAVFFGGNYDRVDITTTAETGKKLLVFKDSYANCFIQFLYPYYEQIIMVDPRYYYDTIQTIMNTEGITDVLYLYNLDTFQADTSLADVLTITQSAQDLSEEVPAQET